MTNPQELYLNDRVTYTSSTKRERRDIRRAKLAAEAQDHARLLTKYQDGRPQQDEQPVLPPSAKRAKLTIPITEQHAASAPEQKQTVRGQSKNKTKGRSKREEKDERTIPSEVTPSEK